jgi:hypothetical protein
MQPELGRGREQHSAALATAAPVDQQHWLYWLDGWLDWLDWHQSNPWLD